MWCAITAAFGVGPMIVNGVIAVLAAAFLLQNKEGWFFKCRQNGIAGYAQAWGACFAMLFVLRIASNLLSASTGST